MIRENHDLLDAMAFVCRDNISSSSRKHLVPSDGGPAQQERDFSDDALTEDGSDRSPDSEKGESKTL